MDDSVRRRAREGALSWDHMVRAGLLTPDPENPMPFWETECSTEGCHRQLVESDCSKCPGCSGDAEYEKRTWPYREKAKAFPIARLRDDGIVLSYEPSYCKCCSKDG